MHEMIEAIKKYVPYCEQESKDKEIILNLINEKNEKILKRDCEICHITSSGFVINEGRDKFLIVHHNIYDTWSWIGGHADGESDLFSVACHEIKEESGIVHIKPDKNEIVSLDILTTSSHYRKNEYVPAHLHLNISYLFIVDVNDPLIIKPDENSAVSWVSVKDIDRYITEKEMSRVFQKMKRYL